MKNILKISITLNVLLAGVVVYQATNPYHPTTCPAIAPSLDTFKVIRVVDGDTFKVFYDGDETSVRFIGIDTPEKGEPGYSEATDKLRELIGGKTVRLEFAAPRKRDNFGRLLANVYCDNIDVGQTMLDSGLAKPYKPRR